MDARPKWPATAGGGDLWALCREGEDSTGVAHNGEMLRCGECRPPLIERK